MADISLLSPTFHVWSFVHVGHFHKSVGSLLLVLN